MKQIQTKHVKLLLLIVCALAVGSWISLSGHDAISTSPAEKYFQTDFQNITEKSIEIQKSGLSNFLSIFQKHKVPLLLFDTDILSEMQKSWRNFNRSYKSSHKLDSQDKDFITFAVQDTQFEGKNDTIVNDLKSHGYTVHISFDIDPRLEGKDEPVQLIPTHLWVAKNNCVIRVAFLNERLGSYFWIGPIRPDHWKDIVNMLAPALTDSKQSMKTLKDKFSSYAQAFDKSSRFFDSLLDIDGYKVNIPHDLAAFLEESKSSEFIECDYKRAREYKQRHEIHLTSKDEDFKKKAKKVILTAKSALDGLKVPFSLSSGSCLGWYRQCDIIPYTIDVDFDILIHNYNEKIIDAMKNVAGLRLLYKFGKLNDSFEFSFIGADHVKLDVFFIYEEGDHFWFGGVRGYDGQKYKYKLPKFKLCWAELLEMKIRVPCNTKDYIEANYGKDWMVPKKDWVWNKSPPNMETNGKWSKSEMKEVIKIF